MAAGLAAAATLSGTVEAAGTHTQRAEDWTKQLVDSAGLADDFSYTFTGIGVGPLGRAVILYANGPNDLGGFDLRVARGPLDSGAFFIDSVAPRQRRIVGGESLALGPKGRAFVSFVRGIVSNQGTLKYAVRSPNGWSVETADAQKSVGISELVLGRLHQPYIAYSKTVDLNPGTSFELWIATKSQGAWTTTKVTDGQIWALDVALNSAGQPEIAYVVDTGLGVQQIAARIARFDGTSWAIEDIGPVLEGGGIEFGIDLLIDPAGHEDVVYPVRDPVQGIMYAHYDGTQWQTQLVAEGNLWQPSMAYDPDGGIHVTYYDANPGRLQYASLVAGSWDIQTIADSASVHVRIGRQSSLAFGPDGSAHVAYYVGREFKGTTLHYAVAPPVAAGKPARFHPVGAARDAWTAARPSRG
jgi:hypothetical protein